LHLRHVGIHRVAGGAGEGLGLLNGQADRGGIVEKALTVGGAPREKVGTRRSGVGAHDR